MSMAKVPDLAALPSVSTPKQLSQAVQMSEGSLAQDRHRGRGIPFVKIGGRVRYLRDDVINYLADNRMQRADASVTVGAPDPSDTAVELKSRA
jgi:hypothetical protein